MRLLALLLASCGLSQGPPCAPVMELSPVLHAVKPPLDDDGTVCSAADGLIEVAHVGVEPSGVRNRYATHYRNHDWVVEDEAGIMRLTHVHDGRTATIRFAPDGDGTRTELRTP